MDSRSSVSLSLLSELRQAVLGNELRLFLAAQGRAEEQPGAGRGGAGRWVDPARGMVPPPMQFIPFAEQTGFIREITRWMLATGVRDGALGRAGPAAQAQHQSSTRDLLDVDLVERVDSLLRLA